MLFLILKNLEEKCEGNKNRRKFDFFFLMLKMRENARKIK